MTGEHANARLITRFYDCFARRDAAGMAACYHARATFGDPVFPRLERREAVAMWALLCERGKDLRLEVSGVQADARNGRAHWVARYTFSKTGRPVVNRIDARFEFEDGLIVQHRDSFDLWAWAGMALGLRGRLLGWLPPVQAAIRKESAQLLANYLASAQPS
jgi:ketosteroid isomerase-like protein